MARSTDEKLDPAAREEKCPVRHHTPRLTSRPSRISVVFRPLGRIVVKGRKQAVPIHEIVGLKEHVTPETRECLAHFARGLACYHQRDWAAATASFQQSAKLEPLQPGRDPGVASNPSLVFLDLVADYTANPPPADWGGVYVMTEK